MLILRILHINIKGKKKYQDEDCKQCNYKYKTKTTSQNNFILHSYKKLMSYVIIEEFCALFTSLLI